MPCAFIITRPFLKNKMTTIRGVIAGIGPVKERQLSEHGITTVEQLAVVEPKTVFWLPGIDRFVSAAKAHLAAKVRIADATAKQTVVPIMTLGPIGQPIGQTMPIGQPSQASTILSAFKFNAPVEASVMESAEAPEAPPTAVSHLIEDHSWFEQQVMVPLHDQGPVGAACVVLQPAVVYELNIDPTNRVSMLCQVVVPGASEPNDQDDGGDKVVSHSFSPQFIYHFNTTLPDLQVNISKADFDAIPNRFVVTNMVEEVNVMRQMLVKPML